MEKQENVNLAIVVSVVTYVMNNAPTNVKMDVTNYQEAVTSVSLVTMAPIAMIHVRNAT